VVVEPKDRKKIVFCKQEEFLKFIVELCNALATFQHLDRLYVDRPSVVQLFGLY